MSDYLLELLLDVVQRPGRVYDFYALRVSVGRIQVCLAYSFKNLDILLFKTIGIAALIGAAFLAIGCWRLRRWSHKAAIVWLATNLLWVVVFQRHVRTAPLEMFLVFLGLCVVFGLWLERYLRKTYRKFQSQQLPADHGCS